MTHQDEAEMSLSDRLLAARLTWEYIDPSPFNPEVAYPWDMPNPAVMGIAE